MSITKKLKLNGIDFPLCYSRLFLLIFLGVVFAIPSILFAQQFRGLRIVPPEEDRSIIRHSDGYHSIAENESTQIAREKALSNAKINALESAKKIIKSKTMLRDEEFSFQLVKNKKGEYVTLLEEKDHGVEENGSKYHVWINAKIKYVLDSLEPESTNNPKPDDVSTVAAGEIKIQPESKKLSKLLEEKGAPLTVRVWTDNTIFKEGEKIKIYLQGNHDFYAKIINTDSKGNVIQFLPNKFQTKNFFKRGEIYEIPDKRRGDKFELESSPPFGIDTLTVFASESPLGNTDLKPIGSGLNKFEGTKKNYDRLVSRGLKLVGEDSPPPVELYKSTWMFETVP